MATTNEKITSGLAWSFAERISAQLVSTLVSIILARLLEPEHYGIISIVMIFISICNILVSDGLGKTLVQKKDADELDFNTLFWLSVGLSVFLYVILFVSSPYIERFYRMKMLSAVIRVLGIRLVLTGVNTIQQAHIQRKLDFRKFFLSTFSATVISAFVGIVMAFRGFGVWALVAQYMVNTFISTIILYFYCGWKPRFKFSYARLKEMLPFSLRVLAQSIIYTLQDNFRSLIIGKRFGSTDLAYYNRGKQFPQLIMTNLNSSISKVMLPVVAREQENINEAKRVTRKAVSVGMYIICPAMIGFCAMGDTFVSVVLTEKWLPAVPYLRLLCLAYMTRPFETTCSSSILAMGHSEITLKNMIIINVVALLTVLIAVIYFESVAMIAVGNLLSAFVSVVLYSYYINKCMKYTFREQLADCLPSLLMSTIMAAVVVFIGYLELHEYLKLILQISLGMGIYILLSSVFKVKELQIVKAYFMRFFKR